MYHTLHYFLTLLLLCPFLRVSAAHETAFGGDISYEHLGKGYFRVDCYKYTQCGGIGQPSSISIKVTPASSASFTATAYLKNTVEISNICSSVCTICSSGCGTATGYGINKSYYAADVDLSGYSDCSFTFSATIGERPSAITTGSASQDLYVEAYLERCSIGWHSSPAFVGDPALVVPASQCLKYLMYAKGNSGDSLVHALTPALTAANTSASYSSGYSYSDPIKSGSGCNLAYTKAGELSFNATKNDVGPVTFKVDQYAPDASGKRIKVGSAMREFTMLLYSISNNYPVLGNFNTTSTRTAYFCAGASNSITISASDKDNSDSIYFKMFSSVPAMNLPSAKGKKFASATISWKPDTKDIRPEPYEVIVRLEDNACPYVGFSESKYYIYVLEEFPEAQLKKADLGCARYSLSAPADTALHYKYEWKINGISRSLRSQADTFQLGANGMHYIDLKITNTSGCDQIIKDSIEVTILPDGIMSGHDTTICEGASVQLSASGGVAYVWSPATGLSSATIADPIASPLSNTTYYLKVTDSKGCIKQDSIIIRQDPVTVSAARDTIICAGRSGTLAAYGKPGLKYRWEPAATVVYPDSAISIVKPKATTMYKLTATNSTGCTYTDSMLVEVKELNPDAGEDVVICEGERIQLHATGGDIYQWNPADGITDLNTADPWVNPVKSQTYILTVSSAGVNCGTRTDQVYVKVLPSFSTQLSQPPLMCPGDTAQLTITGGNKWEWAPAQYLSDPYSRSPRVWAATSTWFTVISTDSTTGCSRKDSVLVKIDKECVMPGDANRDGKINYLDVLFIGGSFNKNGNARAGASAALVFQPVDNWSSSFGGVNAKHSDCNGDGVVDTADNSIIAINYGNNTNYPLTGQQNAARVYLAFEADTLYAGQEAKAALFAGQSSLPFQGLYGIAGRIAFNPLYSQSGTISLNLDDEICGSGTCLNFKRNMGTAGLTDWAISNTSTGNTFSGNGRLATIAFSLPDSNFGYAPTGDWVKLAINELTILDAKGNPIAYSIQNDSVIVYRKKDEGAGIAPADMVDKLTLFPNPAQDELMIRANGLQLKQLSIMNMVGQIVLQQGLAGNNTYLDIQGLPQGVYAVLIECSEGLIQKKLLIQR